MYLVIFHNNGKILLKGKYNHLKEIPNESDNNQKIIIKNPNNSLLTNEIELIKDKNGKYLPKLKQNKTLFCQLFFEKIIEKTTISAYDLNYNAYTFQTNDTIEIKGKIYSDKNLSKLFLDTIEIKLPIFKNNNIEKIYSLKFVKGILKTKTITFEKSGLYRIIENEISKIKLVDTNKKILTKIDIIISE